MTKFTGWRYALFIGTLVGGIGAAIYPIILQPFMDPGKWQKIQRDARSGDDRTQMQPGGMKVWTNPFDKKT